MLFFCFTRYLRWPKRKYTKVIYSRRRYIYIFFLLCLCEHTCTGLRGRKWRGEDSIESPKSLHLLLRHRSFMAPALDKAPDEASRKTDKSANKSGLWLFPRPSFTPFITCTLHEFEYRTGRHELLRPAPPVWREISFFVPLFPLFFLF